MNLQAILPEHRPYVCLLVHVTATIKRFVTTALREDAGEAWGTKWTRAATARAGVQSIRDMLYRLVDILALEGATAKAVIQEVRSGIDEATRAEVAIRAHMQSIDPVPADPCGTLPGRLVE